MSITNEAVGKAIGDCPCTRHYIACSENFEITQWDDYLTDDAACMRVLRWLVEHENVDTIEIADNSQGTTVTVLLFSSGDEKDFDAPDLSTAICEAAVWVGEKTNTKG